MSTGVAQQIVAQKSMVDTATDDSKGIIPWGQRPAPTMPFSIDNIKVPINGTADYGNLIYIDVPITAGDYLKDGYLTLTFASSLAPALTNQPLYEIIEYMSVEFGSVEIERFYCESVVAWNMICLTQEQKNLMDTIASTAGKVNPDGSVSASIPLWLWFYRSPALACPLSPLYASPRIKIKIRAREELPFVTASLDGNDYVLTATGQDTRNTPRAIISAEVSLNIVLLPPAARFAVATSIREYLIEQSWRNDIRQFTRTTTGPRSITVETKENNPMKSRFWFTQRQARIRDSDNRDAALAAIGLAATANARSGAASDQVNAQFNAATLRWSSVYNANESASRTDVTNHLCDSAEIIFSGYPRLRVQPGYFYSQVQRRAAGTMGRISNPTIREAIMQFHDALHPANPTQPSGSYNPMFTDKDTLNVTFPPVRAPNVNASTDPAANVNADALTAAVNALQTQFTALSNAYNTLSTEVTGAQTATTAVTTRVENLRTFISGITNVGGNAADGTAAITSSSTVLNPATPATIGALADTLTSTAGVFAAATTAATALVTAQTNATNARDTAATAMTTATNAATAAAAATTAARNAAHLDTWLARARGTDLFEARDGSATELTCRMQYFIIYFNVRRIGDGQMRNLFF